MKCAFFLSQTTQAITLSVLLVFFGWLLPHYRFCALFCLGLMAVVTGLQLSRTESFLEIVGWRVPERRCVSLIISIFSGMLISSIYRWRIGASITPTNFYPAVGIYVAIGFMEEFITRGMIFGLARQKGQELFPLLLSTFVHTGYKTFLFLPFPVVDVGTLALYTFLTGLVLGCLRIWSKSIWPSMLVHGIFDFMAYGDRIEIPWWIWT